MPSTRSQPRLIRSAAVALALWLLAVVAVVFWRRPEFWVEPHKRFQRAQTLAYERHWPEALAAIDRALAADPDNAGYLVFRGYRQLDLGRPADAEQSFRHALRVDPSSVDARLGFAAALARLDKREAALAALQPLSPDTIGAAQLRQRSQLYTALGARQAALDDLSHLLNRDPNNTELLREAAMLAVAQEEWRRAASLTERLGAASQDPAVRQWAASTRGMALEATGQVADAYAAYGDAQDPGRLETRAYMALELGRHLEAAELLDKLSSDRPSEPRFRRSLAFALLAAGRSQAAERVFRALIADGAADPAVRQAYAWLLNVQHRYAEAWTVLEPLPRPARDPELLELQARTALWAGRLSEAAHLIRALLTARPNDPELWKRLAEVSDGLGEDLEAADALRAYVRLQSQDWRARQRLAEILAARGSLQDAIEEYRALADADPTNAGLHRSLGLVQETAGELGAAVDSYLRAIELSPGDEAADLYLRLARLYRWTVDPGAAARWYSRYLGTISDPALRRPIESELALSLLESGEHAESLSLLERTAARVTLDPGELRTAARAATATGQPAAAARFIERLGEQQALSLDEQRWLAGMYRASGQRERALAVYERIAGAAGNADAPVLEAIGDLRYDLGDFSGVVRAFRGMGEAPDVSLKIARASVRAGDLAAAAESYERYLRARPGDIAGRLEAARYYASAGRPQQALAHYRDVVSAGGAAGLRLELARIHLAAEEFEGAEQWARQAIAAGEDSRGSSLALAQSLHLQGRSRDADAVLRDLIAAAPHDAEALIWKGQAALALDRHLEAYRSFARADATGAAPRERALLWMAAAAQRRGDIARAHVAIGRANAEGTSTPEMDAARQELRAGTRPRVFLPVWVHADTNDLRIRETGAGTLWFSPPLHGVLSLDGFTGTVSQRQFDSRRTSAVLTVDHLFPIPELELAVSLGFDQYTRAPDLMTWRTAATYHFTNGAAAGLSGGRESVLPSGTRSDLRQFNRVLDLGALGPDFYFQGLRGFADLAVSRDRRARVEAGVDEAKDGNRRLFTYAHYQLPLATGARDWVALRPNLFFETFRDRRPFYFSPSRHLTLGAMLHAIRQRGRWSLELELNPQWLRTDRANAVGAHGLLNVGVIVRGVSIGGGTFVFYDGLEDYFQWRLGGRIGVPLGR